MSMHLLMLEVAGTGIEHFTLHDDEQLTAFKSRYLKELQAGIFPNAIFQQAFNESSSKQVNEKIITGDCESVVYHAGHRIIDEILANPNKDIRLISNIGDWLGKPGFMVLPDQRKIAVTDVYKYIITENLFTAPLVVSCTEVDYFVGKEDIIISHLIARDAFYDQAYVDKNGVRSFLRYEPRTDKTRESTLGVNHHAAAAVRVEHNEYPTIDAAAFALNLPVSVVFNRVNSGKTEWIGWCYINRHNARSITYILRHSDDPGFYIGSTTVPKMRFSTHLSKLKSNKHGTPKLQALIKLKGAEGLYPEIVFEGTEEECRAKEQELVTLYKDDPNLLNASLNTRSAISHHVQDPEVEKRRVENLRKVVTQDDYREKHSDTMKAAWSVPGRKEARSGAGNPFAKHVSIHGVVYGSVIDAVRSKAGGLTDWVIRTRLKAGTDPEIFYCDAEGNKVT